MKLTDLDKPLTSVSCLCQQNVTNVYQNLQKAIDFNSDAENERQQTMRGIQKQRQLYTETLIRLFLFMICTLRVTTMWQTTGKPNWHVFDLDHTGWKWKLGGGVDYHRTNGYIHVKSEDFRMKAILCFCVIIQETWGKSLMWIILSHWLRCSMIRTISILSTKSWGDSLRLRFRIQYVLLNRISIFIYTCQLWPNV